MIEQHPSEPTLNRVDQEEPSRVSANGGKPSPLDELTTMITAKLIQQIKAPPCLGARAYTTLGKGLETLSRLGGRGSEHHLGPDKMIIVSHGLPIPGNIATTLGECVHLLDEYAPQKQRFLLNHEYIHVLQYRAMGWVFLPRYVLERFKARLKHQDPYSDNPLETQALSIEAFLREHPWLPDIWQLQ